jgi:hypothetical protein
MSVLSDRLLLDLLLEIDDDIECLLTILLGKRGSLSESSDGHHGGLIETGEAGALLEREAAEFAGTIHAE